MSAGKVGLASLFSFILPFFLVIVFTGTGFLFKLSDFYLTKIRTHQMDLFKYSAAAAFYERSLFLGEQRKGWKMIFFVDIERKGFVAAP